MWSKPSRRAVLKAAEVPVQMVQGHGAENGLYGPAWLDMLDRNIPMSSMVQVIRRLRANRHERQALEAEWVLRNDRDQGKGVLAALTPDGPIYVHPTTGKRVLK